MKARVRGVLFFFLLLAVFGLVGRVEQQEREAMAQAWPSASVASVLGWEAERQLYGGGK